mmetsp:Transcript_11161/g.15026  ORF Transcript_11161/g.15026 Transcript_11161/m.15026 type:complete len:80 (+) Transcript_11161:384-623(+)
MFKEHMGEAGPEVGSIDIELFLAWQVDINAARAVNLHTRCRQLLRHSDWQNVLSLAEHSGAGAKSTLLVLIAHFVEPVG